MGSKVRLSAELCVLFCFFTGCQVESATSSTESDALRIEATSSEYGVARVTVGNIELRFDAYDGVIESAGPDWILDAHTKSLLAAERDRLENAIRQRGTPITFEENALGSVLDVMSDAPNDYVWKARIWNVPALPRPSNVVDENAGAADAVAGGTHALLSDDGIVCVEKGRSTLSYYDDRDGDVWRGYLVPSESNECLGRCGSSCSIFGSTQWTLDCLEHDKCSGDLGGAWNPYDADCGDEFGYAVADGLCLWCGCRG